MNEAIKSENRYPKELGNSYFLHHLYERAYFNASDCIIAVVGETGSGKTNFSLAAAELLSIPPQGCIPRFKAYSKAKLGKIEDYKSFKLTKDNFEYVVPDLCYGSKQLQDFWNRMNKLADRNIDLCHGRPVILEEAQNIVNSRTYYGQTNMRYLRNLLTGRVFQNIYFLTYPSFNDIDKQIRKLLHYRVDMLQPNRKDGYFRFKFKVLKDIEKNEYGTYMRKVDYQVDDFFRIPTKFNIPIPILPASPELFHLARLKGTFWKMAVRANKVDDKTGNYVEEGMAVKAPVKQDKATKIIEWAIANFNRRRDFVNTNTGRYTVSRIAAAMGSLSNTYGSIAVEHWNVMEKKDIV